MPLSPSLRKKPPSMLLPDEVFAVVQLPVMITPGDGVPAANSTATLLVLAPWQGAVWYCTLLLQLLQPVVHNRSVVAVRATRATSPLAHTVAFKHTRLLVTEGAVN